MNRTTKDEAETPYFSIVTPSYNYGCYIRDCIESVLAQEGVTYEHLIQDGGSNDDTLSILAEYPHLSVVSEPDSGMSEAINKGFRRARGKWVMWLNTDDVLLPGALKSVHDFLEAGREELDVAYGGWKDVDANLQTIRETKAFPFDARMLAMYACYIASTALLMRRETTIDQGLLLDESFRYAMDVEFYCRLAAAGKKFAPVPACLALFRLHGDNLSSARSNDESVKAELIRQRQVAEDETIRRIYGVNLFKGRIGTRVQDTVLYVYYKWKRSWWKRCSRWKMRKYPSSGA